MTPFPRVLLFAVLLASAPLGHAAKLLVSNVNGYTLDSQGKLQQFQALLVDDGKVVATGSTAELQSRADGARFGPGGRRGDERAAIERHGHSVRLG